MTREEAIKIVRENMHLSYDKGNTFKALQTLVPELAEWSEDERIRKALVEYFAPPVSFTTVRGIPVQKVRDWLEKQKEENHNGKKWLTPEELHRIEQLRYEAGFDAGVRSEAEKQKGQKPAENSVCPHSLDEAIQLYYSTYGNGKGGFDHISLPKFQDIVEEFVKDYGQKPTEWSNEDENKIERLAFLVSVAEEKEMISSSESIDLRNLIKSLCPQPKQEWSEEDKGLLVKCISALQNSGNWFLADKLSSLCPQPSWKPSEEQMKALKEAAEYSFYGGEGAILRTLYNDLQKRYGTC